MPARNGLAMRAGVSVEGLHRHHELTVAVIRSSFETAPLDWVRRHSGAVIDMPCATDRQSATSWLWSERGRRVARHPLPALARYQPPSVGQRIIDEAGRDFDVVVVMGTYVAGAALPLLDAGVAGILDAFDDDARTNASLAKLDPSYAAEIPRYDAFQREVFPWFDHVLFSSLEDAVPPFVHLPNAVHIPPTWSLSPRGQPLELLFVGNPSYLPNRDALTRLRDGIVPAIERLGVQVQLLHPRADDDVGPFYGRAHIAAVPLRAAGGTRIKILEAFAHGCPVVSTPTGARGLGVTAGEQLVVTADDDDDLAFAEAVVELARDEDRRAPLAQTARAFVVAHHDRRDVGAQLAGLVEDRARARSGSAE
jgi:glycosyltransferase involved in cell wall biosynthesis